MWINKINPFKYTVINNFSILYNIAKTLKGCHYFVLDYCILYGIPSDNQYIRSLILPEEFNYSISFRLDTIDLDILSKYDSFVLYEELQEFLIPYMYKDDIDSLKFKFSQTQLRWKANVDIIDLIGVDTDKSALCRQNGEVIQRFINNLYSFRSIGEIDISNITDELKYKNEVKLSVPCVNNTNIGLFLYKSIINSNKGDIVLLRIIDTFDGYYTGQIIIHHKKNKLPISNIEESTYFKFINIYNGIGT